MAAVPALVLLGIAIWASIKYVNPAPPNHFLADAAGPGTPGASGPTMPSTYTLASSNYGGATA